MQFSTLQSNLRSVRPESKKCLLLTELHFLYFLSIHDPFRRNHVISSPLLRIAMTDIDRGSSFILQTDHFQPRFFHISQTLSLFMTVHFFSLFESSLNAMSGWALHSPLFIQGAMCKCSYSAIFTSNTESINISPVAESASANSVQHEGLHQTRHKYHQW